MNDAVKIFVLFIEDAAIPEISIEITADGIKSERVSSDEIGELNKAIQVEIGYGKRCSRCWVPTRDAATSPTTQLSTQTNYSSTKDCLIPSELSTNSAGKTGHLFLYSY